MNSQIIQIITEDDEVYQFEAVASHSGNDTSTLTSYPTSEGTPRTDNIYNNPNKFDCSISIGGSENISDEWGINEDRPKSAMNVLTKWKEDAVALTIITPQKDYFNMFLTGISPQNNNQNSFNLTAGLSFNELRIANFSTETINITNVINIAQDSPADTNSNDISPVGKVGIVAGAAAVGATIGSVVPGIGTAAGALIGALAGVVVLCINKVCDYTEY